MSTSPSITLNFSSEVLALLRPKQAAAEIDLLKVVEELKAEIKKQSKVWLTYDEAAEYAGLSKSTIITKCELKKIARHYLDDIPRIHRDDIDAAFGRKPTAK